MSLNDSNRDAAVEFQPLSEAFIYASPEWLDEMSIERQHAERFTAPHNFSGSNTGDEHVSD